MLCAWSVLRRLCCAQPDALAVALGLALNGHVCVRAEENVDQVVAGDAIKAVVPLLTFYSDVDGEGPTYQCGPAQQGVCRI